VKHIKSKFIFFYKFSNKNHMHLVLGRVEFDDNRDEVFGF